VVRRSPLLPGFRVVLLPLLLAVCVAGLPLAAPAGAVQKKSATRKASAAKPFPAVQALLDRAAKETLEKALKTLDEAARVAQWRKDTPGLLAVADRALAIGKAHRENHRDDTVERSFFERAVAIREKHLPNSLQLAGALNWLGSVTADLTRKKAIFQRALAMGGRVDPNSLIVADSLYRLGNHANNHERDLAAAKPLLQRALAIRQKGSPAAIETASILHNLGAVAGNEGNYAAAIELWQRCLEIEEKLVPGTERVVVTLEDLGFVAKRRRDLAAARDFYQHALVIRQKLKPGSVEVANTLSHLAFCFADYDDHSLTTDQKDYVKARKLLE
jgi:tetratricopeptide (TPR) repeat protein